MAVLHLPRVFSRQGSARAAHIDRLHTRLLEGVDVAIPGVTRSRPHIVFTRQKVAVYLDGCFWHCCPEHGTIPKANHAWWQEKLEANVERDARHVAELEEAG